ncbi:hypothetical protein ACRAWD_30845 [Caulobacter segnis]
MLTNGGGNANLTPETAKTLYDRLPSIRRTGPAEALQHLGRLFRHRHRQRHHHGVSAQDIVHTLQQRQRRHVLAGHLRDRTDRHDQPDRLDLPSTRPTTRPTAASTSEISYATGFDRIIPQLAPGRIRARWLMTWVSSLTTNDGVSKIE